MDLGISGRKALVFGGSRGMGRACALQLAREGVAVTIAARNPKTLEEAAAEISRETGTGVGWVSADLTLPQGRDAAMAACPSTGGRVEASGWRRTVASAGPTGPVSAVARL